MLTIKQVERSGHESIQQFTSTSYDRGGVKVEGSEEISKPMLIGFGCTARGGAVDEHGVCRYGCGMIYIMNETGSTVAKYDLD